MAQITHQELPVRQLRIVRALLGVAVLGALTASVAGLWLIVTDPTSGSTTAAGVGSIAATGGLAAALCTVAAVVYAQIRNLWRYAPTWVRAAVWGLIAWSVLATLWTR